MVTCRHHLVLRKKDNIIAKRERERETARESNRKRKREREREAESEREGDVQCEDVHVWICTDVKM